jgi:hypothetical protein
MGERAIAAVSETLRAMLAEAMLRDPSLVERDEHVLLASPAEIPHDRHTRLGIFLYHIAEHVLSRPEAMHIRGPLGFSLSYLITPVGPDPLLCQEIMARVLRDLHDRARINVQEAGGELEVALLRHTLEEKLQLWAALDTPYSCALYYGVRIVQLICEPSQ